MTEENKKNLIKRLKSFAWRSLVVFLLGLIAWISKIIPELNLPEIIVMFIALMFGEVTKWLNSNTNLFGKRK